MSLETGNRINALVATNPVGATDFVSHGDDHIRLIKACVQGSFPNLGGTAVAATAEEINFVDGVTSSVQTQFDALAAGKQPLDADLTAIAALTTNTFGRSLLTLADAAAGRSSLGVYSAAAVDAGFQPLDADLSAIAALTTNTFGRSLLTALTATAALGLMAAGDVTWSGAHVWSGNLLATATTGFRFYRITTTGADAFMAAEGATPGTLFTGSLAYAAIFGSNANAAAQIVQNGVVRVTITASLVSLTLPLLAPKIAASTSTTLAVGQIHHISGNATLPTLAEGEWVCVVNNSASAITITEHSGDTTYWTATAASISTVTVPARGRIVASGAGSGVVYVSGDISGST